MGKYRKTVQVVILLAVLVIGGYAIGTTVFSNDSRGPIKVGDKMPDFTLANLEGGVTSLSDFVGQPVIINFWGTFCEPCVREMPAFEGQFQKWKDEGLVVLAINLSEDSLTVNNFVSRLGLTYPILRDQGRKTERRYALRSYPTTFFVKPNGELFEVVTRELTQEDIEERVKVLLQM